MTLDAECYMDFPPPEKRAMTPTNQEMQQELKPCPFCGSAAVIANGQLYSWGQCLRCGTTNSGRTTEEKALIAWNNRADSSELSALRQQLAETQAEINAERISCGESVALLIAQYAEMKSQYEAEIAALNKKLERFSVIIALGPSEITDQDRQWAEEQIARLYPPAQDAQKEKDSESS